MDVDLKMARGVMPRCNSGMGYRRPMRALRGLAALAMVCALAACGGAPKPVPVAVAAPQPQTALASRLDAKGELAPVSYTHLTLPTIA